MVIDYFYVAALYGLLSLWARLVSGADYRRHALMAFAAAFILFCLRFIPVYDAQNLRLAVALLAGGLLVSALSAALGQAIWRGLRPDEPPPRPRKSAASTGRTRLHFSE
ncbi:hypothetical protein [Asticcacaulis sp. EMRT-3]|uniref:hypothetical protein n=1 Tax=Asticcacaulis sp. EMRT-3 TaxID=3040349 RepID=UPI0024AF004A|nr:hypothetical protein [Asticcacaulis sp. EMRT-3]MDI7775115.1 hypothetical protein [Asticcacaulis sp. EMRT-3]